MESPLRINGVATGYTIGLALTATALFLRWWPQIVPEKIGQLKYSNPTFFSLAKKVFKKQDQRLLSDTGDVSMTITSALHTDHNEDEKGKEDIEARQDSRDSIISL